MLWCYRGCSEDFQDSTGPQHTKVWEHFGYNMTSEGVNFTVVPLVHSKNSNSDRCICLIPV